MGELSWRPLQEADRSAVAGLALACLAADGGQPYAADADFLGGWYFGTAATSSGWAVGADTEMLSDGADALYLSRGLTQVFAEDVMRLAAPAALPSPSRRADDRGDAAHAGRRRDHAHGSVWLDALWRVPKATSRSMVARILSGSICRSSARRAGSNAGAGTGPADVAPLAAVAPLAEPALVTMGATTAVAAVADRNLRRVEPARG